MEMMGQGTQGLCHEGLATETGLSAIFAPRRTRVVCVGGGDEKAGILLQRSPRNIEDKELLSFGVFFLCSFFSRRVSPPPFPPVPSLLPLALQRRKRERRDGITCINPPPVFRTHFPHGWCLEGASWVSGTRPGVLVGLSQ